MSARSITWDLPNRKLVADPGATLALDRNAWEGLGAHFHPVDDGQGETPNLATASVSTAEGSLAIGILDYGESTTYLLVPRDGLACQEATSEILESLADSGAIRLDHDIVDVARRTPPHSLEQRVDELERQLERINAGFARLDEVLPAEVAND